MNLDKLPPWLRAAVASTGGLGLFLVAFLDSSVLTFPVINDLLVVQLSIQNPARMPYYALMATLGSVTGCILLYYLAEKGGEVYFRRHAGHRRAERIRGWLERNGFLSVLVAALLPPPTPFKFFVLAAGVFEVPLRTFTLALLLARSFRYFGEGFLAVQYGPAAAHFLQEHKVESALIAVGTALLFYLLGRLALRRLHLRP
jgi:membrane protein YqaA with SNARE-associated domain